MPLVLRALLERRADILAEDVAYSYGPDAADECAPRAEARGRSDASRALDQDLEGGAPELVALVGDGPELLFEARVVDGVPIATVGASLRLDDTGAVARVLSFRTAPVEPNRASMENVGDARAVLDAYFERLERADFAGAAACFSRDVFYSHPPYGPGLPRVEYRGRDALEAGFAARGPRSWRHRIITFRQRGADVLVEGDVAGLGVWLSSFSLGEDGLISRYCAFYAR